MQVGLFTIVPWHENLTAEQSLRDALEQITLADQLSLKCGSASIVSRVTACSQVFSPLLAT